MESLVGSGPELEPGTLCSWPPRDVIRKLTENMCWALWVVPGTDPCRESPSGQPQVPVYTGGGAHGPQGRNAESSQSVTSHEVVQGGRHWGGPEFKLCRPAVGPWAGSWTSLGLRLPAPQLLK